VGWPYRTNCAATTQTTAVGRRWLCPLLPAHTYTEPANPDQLQLPYKLSSNSVALVSTSDPQSTGTSVCVFAIFLLQQTLHPFLSRPSHPFTIMSLTATPLTINPPYWHYQHSVTEIWYFLMDADFMDNSDVYPRRLKGSATVPPLPVGTYRNDIDGVVRTLSVRRYSTSCNLEVSKCRWEHLPKELLVRVTVDILMSST
jgi:hypothetical protein